MRRREFITLLGGAAAAWPGIAGAQQPGIPILGFLHAASAGGYAKETAAVLSGLEATGFIEGRNLRIEYRWADGQYDRLRDLAADLVERRVNIIVAMPTVSALAAKSVTTTIPIVFEGAVDPVRLGLVTSLNRPGANITGIINLAVSLISKRIELIHELVPNAKTIAVLLNPTTNPIIVESVRTESAIAERALGIKVEILQADTLSGIEAAFLKVADMRQAALVAGVDPFFDSKWKETAELAVRYRVPTSHEVRDFVAAGGLMSYAADLPEAYRLTGVYAGRVLKGEKPAELPVQQASKVTMVINLKAAKALGITVPISLLGRADEVIE
jgi:putative tryptophan/tyrosine transport system substrate-binding protein